MIGYGSFRLGLALALISGTPKYSAHHSHAAVPQTIVFSGAPLTHRIVLRDFSENTQLIQSLVHGVVEEDTIGRTAIDVAMFYARSGGWTSRPADSIPLGLADMRGRYYPARDKRPALLLPRLTIAGSMRAAAVSDAGQRILARHGIPTGPISAP